MQILFCHPNAAPGEAERWQAGLTARLGAAGLGVPGFTIRTPEVAAPPADYALLWNPPPAALLGQTRLRAAFALGAGVDALLGADVLPPGVPLYRLEDAGMAAQMVEYALHAVLRWQRRFDEYEALAARGEWRTLTPRPRPLIAVLGLGALGGAVASAFAGLGYRVRGWSRSPRTLAGVEGFAGPEALMACLDGAGVLIDLLPLTAGTRGLLDGRVFAQLMPGALFVNLARGAHVVEADLLAALAGGRLSAAVLDVFGQEPLPAGHALRDHPEVTVTPHIAALTRLDAALDSIAAAITAIEAGATAVLGRVDPARGY
ncbi:MAG TPA: glyoxylate/hydroxypyruvate reductase A [Plasticicumulans sp.]|uniref:2-hydroxyacid dehydrogenase n=1 Tax=Plasticicumulans sp. TaxID=2307179 RepID=UPI002C4E0997|nr:glyoxylate/hydroxypyruvate reductase A [Plasticicumulans sp.]HNG50271.1 glyoxylate/hydroxypyruvate reductase A [Plasticicumulans sp.]